MQGDELLHPADLALVRYIRLRKAKTDSRNYIKFEPSWVGDFTNAVNLSLNDTRIRFGMGILQEWQCICLFALAPAPWAQMETLQLIASFDGDEPSYQLTIFDPHMSKRSEYQFFSISDPKNGLLAVLTDVYGDQLKFHEWHYQWSKLVADLANKDFYMVQWEATPIPKDHPLYKQCTAKFDKLEEAKRIAKERSSRFKDVFLYKFIHKTDDDGLTSVDMKVLWDSRLAEFKTIDEVGDE